MRLSRLERFLRLFTDVRAGEGATALLMFANVFLILCAYYFIKPLREGWIAISDISGPVEDGGQGLYQLRTEPGPDPGRSASTRGSRPASRGAR